MQIRMGGEWTLRRRAARATALPEAGPSRGERRPSQGAVAPSLAAGLGRGPALSLAGGRATQAGAPYPSLFRGGREARWRWLWEQTSIWCVTMRLRHATRRAHPARVACMTRGKQV